jgi:plasmid stabilization system protein ParE
VTRSVKLHPAAAHEVTEARTHYEQISSELADAFINELTITLERAARLPESGRPWSQADTGRRVYLLERFPYLVIARADLVELRVIAVAHQRRKPEYWRKRDR